MRLAILIAVVLLLLAGALCLPRPYPLACPPGTHADPDRQARLVARLQDALPRLATPEAQAVSQSPELGAWCFGQESELREQGPLLLDQDLGDDEATARAAHLLLHLLVAPWPPSQAPCAERVKAAVNAEARALSLELELRQALGVTTPKVAYAFAAEHQQTPPAQRTALLERLLHAFPDGAPGVPGLAGAYAQRCRASEP